MTDELRRLADANGALTIFENGEECINAMFEKGYAAGRESMRAEPTWNISAEPFMVENITIDTRYQFEQTLKAERARSAKLVDALDKYKMEGCARNQFGEVEWARKAIAEYEASRG